ncbi:hypothetical protein ADUPG1_006079 [Aduncisulcus paluster]|uniref:Uncharacterized protein n=1 Tax=Aduncisulcus paluster TaxID=2918883 RepID=A0ABQ5KJS2_9EUKA|nr:hypothetical protein ADUPG1_006079 [Aduncisulcus paluster]
MKKNIHIHGKKGYLITSPGEELDITLYSSWKKDQEICLTKDQVRKVLYAITYKEHVVLAEKAINHSLAFHYSYTRYVSTSRGGSTLQKMPGLFSFCFSSLDASYHQKKISRTCNH